MKKHVAALFGLALIAGCASHHYEADAMAHYWKNELDTSESLFRKASRNGKLSDSSKLYYAETLRRNRKLNESDSILEPFLRRPLCNPIALAIKGDIWNPQFGNEAGNTDSSFRYYRLSNACDPSLLQVNCMLWILGQYYQDSSMEEQALRHMDRYSSWSPKAYAVNKWILKSCPPRSVLFVNGDVDTYPAKILQQDSGFRKDVAVLNISLLNLKWYALDCLKKLRISTDSLALKRISYPEQNAVQYSFSDSVIALLADSLKDVRPVCFSISLDSKNTAPYDSNLQLIGAVWQLGHAKPAQKYDYVKIAGSLEGLSYRDFQGEMYTENDRSPVRKSASKDRPFEKMILSLGSWSAQQLYANGEQKKGVELFDWVKEFNVNTLNDEKYNRQD